MVALSMVKQSLNIISGKSLAVAGEGEGEGEGGGEGGEGQLFNFDGLSATLCGLHPHTL